MFSLKLNFFNLQRRLLSPSKVPRYLHSATIINGMLLIYGGNGHNITDDNSADVCFSPHFIAYDISCDTWRTLKMPYIPDAQQQEYLLGRYGHSSVVYDDSLYIFGGFNGIMHNSLLKYVPANCSRFDSHQECSRPELSSKCLWNKEKQICQSFNQIKSSAASNSCPNNKTETIQSELCSKQSICSNCVTTTYECVWCGDKCLHKKCGQLKSIKEQTFAKTIRDASICESRDQLISNCDKLHNCHSCHTEHYCTWQRERKCVSLMFNTESWVENKVSKQKNEKVSQEEERPTCEAPCHTRTTCENCTQGSCMWCSSQKQCIEVRSPVMDYVCC